MGAAHQDQLVRNSLDDVDAAFQPEGHEFQSLRALSEDRGSLLRHPAQLDVDALAVVIDELWLDAAPPPLPGVFEIQALRLRHSRLAAYRTRLSPVIPRLR